MPRAPRAERPTLARLGYRLDRFLDLRPSGQIAAVLGLGAVLGLVFGAVIFGVDRGLGPPPGGAPEAGPHVKTFAGGFWWAITRMLDGGTVAGDAGSGALRQGFGLVVTLVGLFAVAVVTGWFASRLSDRLGQLRRGTAPVFEQRHVLVLGWNAHAPVVLGELAASGLAITVVILADHDREAIEDTLRLPLAADHRLKVIVRRGDPSSAADVRRCAARRARAILVLPDMPSGHCGDRAALRSLLAVERGLGDMALRRRPEIIVEVATQAGRDMVRLCDTGEQATVVDAHDVNARVVAQAVRFFGAFEALRAILALGDHSIDLLAAGTAAGKTFDAVYAAHEDGILVGIARRGAPHFAPPGDFLVEEGDALLVLDDAVEVKRSRVAVPRPEKRPGTPAGEEVGGPIAEAPLRVLVIRFRPGLGAILSFLEAKGPVEVTLLAPESELAHARDHLQRVSLARTSVRYAPGDPLDGKLLARLADEGTDAMLLLAPDVETGAGLEADADQLLSLLQIRRGRPGDAPHAVVEVRHGETRKLPKRLRHRDDFVLSREMVGMLLARELHMACIDARRRAERDGVVASPTATFAVLESVGSALEVIPAARYAEEDAVTFGELAAAARKRGEIAVGLFEDGRPPRMAPLNELRVRPARARLVVLTRHVAAPWA